MKKADVDEAALKLIVDLDLWGAVGKIAEQYVMYIAGILDFASQIKEMCDD